MTKIIYTITLVNSDGSQASASTAPLEYPETQNAVLNKNAQEIAHDLAESHLVMSQLLSVTARSECLNGNTLPPSNGNNGTKTVKHRAGGR